jgi:carbon storage regulator
MLVLTRKKGEKIIIQLADQTVVVSLLEVKGDRARIGVDADRSVAVHREEVLERIQNQQG